jgi:uncharacterized protein with von Willebrand factor type A (vWA) domain
MKARRRNISIFSISALDLFAAALAAFILIVLVLFPYYRMGGTDISMEELEEQVKKRREAASSTKTDMSIIRALRAEIRLLDKQYKTSEDNMSIIRSKILEVQKQTADVEIPEPPPIPKPDPVPEPIPEPPRSVNTGVEFSILGLGTSKKKIAIVVDMSGSMQAHTSKVTTALNEILEQMKPDYQFVIIGYRGGPTYDTFPRNGRMGPASASNIQGAYDFVQRLPRRFGGGTPTQNAMMKTLNLRPEAIILISDGQPDDGAPRAIVNNVTARNRGKAEIHTVAIGDYTKDKQLTLFLQEMARLNRGDFVGRAR